MLPASVLSQQRYAARRLYEAVLEGTRPKCPQTRMWAGHAAGLARFHNALMAEWMARGRLNTLPLLPATDDAPLPWWFAWRPLHLSHLARLNRKEGGLFFVDGYDSYDCLLPYEVSRELGTRNELLPAAAVCRPLVLGKRKAGAD